MNLEELKEALEFTSKKTGFSTRLIEKDYYCSVILNYIYSHPSIKETLIFKGGTLLAKAYADFYRLSEDLDFSVLNEISLTRSNRREFASKLRSVINSMTKDLGIKEVSMLKGFNESKQYNALFEYSSFMGIPETIKFEIGLRNDLMSTGEIVKLKTILINAMSNKMVIPVIEVRGLSLEEAYAEKYRAALTRKEPAIRDFFDLWQAHKQNLLPNATSFYNCIKFKLSRDPSARLNMSTEKKKNLQEQINYELNSVLRSTDLELFNLDEAWNLVSNTNYALFHQNEIDLQEVQLSSVQD